MSFSKTISIILLSSIVICTILYINNSSCEENYKCSIEKYYKTITPSAQSMRVFDKTRSTSNQSKGNIAKTVREQHTAENNSKIRTLLAHVVYINLFERPDRKAQVKKELEMFGLPYTRIEGVVSNFGGLGCSMAHLKALQYAKKKNFKNVLILEDDCKFKYNRNKLYNNLVQALSYLGEQYDVLMLTGGNIKSYRIRGTAIVRKLESAQTRTAYCVNSTYYDTLIQNFEDNINELRRRGPSSYSGSVTDQVKGFGFAGDQYWKHLQPVDRWFIMKPRQCKQRKSYSDIQKITTHYFDS